MLRLVVLLLGRSFFELFFIPIIPEEAKPSPDLAIIDFSNFLI